MGLRLSLGFLVRVVRLLAVSGVGLWHTSQIEAVIQAGAVQTH